MILRSARSRLLAVSIIEIILNISKHLVSDSQHISKLQYEWKSVTPVQKMPAMSVPNMEVSTHSTSYCNVMTSTGMYVQGFPQKPSNLENTASLRK